MMHRRWRALEFNGVLGIALLVACSPESGGLGNASNASVGAEETGTTEATEATDTTGTTGSAASSGVQDGTQGSGSQDSTSDTGAQDSTSEGPPPVCGNAMVEADEQCDDANADEADGCLSTCVAPQSCAQILAEVPGAADGPYRLELPSGPLEAYCDMTTEGGGWILAAKVNPTNQNTAPRSEPLGWFDMELSAELLVSPDLMLNGPLASHGGSRFAPLVVAGTQARFELIAADDFDVTASWYKEVLAANLSSWFDFGDMPTMVCSDQAMSVDCSMGTIAPTAGVNSPTLFQGMDLVDFGYPSDYPTHMRLDNDGSNPSFSGVCSSTGDRNGNQWPDSYSFQWGNALRIWLR